MFKKVGYSSSEITPLSSEAVLADPVIVDRMTKLAHEIKSIAPKSDDFLYFSIIFIKAAESALIDEKGDLKKVGRERAWGYFDDNWRWHGNVRPHKNSNSDIFPEAELKKAARDWIGKPLCKDHISDSVDGIRGIILDTHYDEKLKQVVGLCALDRINYADLAKKVETGIVRYGSMGTAVEVSVCSECGNKAKTAKEYCDHVTKRSAWGEINVGLKPIEYSLVVQPAEAGAVLLKCIASLKSYRDEFVNYGVDNFEEMLGSLSSEQAQHLNTIVKTACGDEGCSITERKKIITSFLTKNNLLKVASTDAPVVQGSPQNMENFTSGQTTNPITGLVGSDDFDVKDYTGASGSLIASPSDSNEFQAGGVIPDNTWDAKKASVSKFAAEEENDHFNKSMLSSVLEDIMSESSLRKRAELRRKLAYHQGGSDKAVEPATFKKETFSFEADKQMHQDGKMGGAEGSFPGDQDIKQKLSRAQLEERRLRRLAYFQGASEGAEPKTFKSEPFPFDEDKQMHQDGKMGGDKGMFPGDQQLKEKMKRASYEGPALSTKLSWAPAPSGQINKSAAVFEVFAGDKRVIAATGSEIFGDELSQNWDWFTSKEYGQEVCKQIRASGLDHVTMLLKGAQEMPPAPPMGPEAGAPPAPPMPPMPPMAPPAGEAPEMSDEGDDSPKKTVEDALVSIEEAVAKARDALGKIEGGGKVTVNIDADQGAADVESGGEEVKLSREISQQLKVALAELDESADELAMIAETYENAHRLSSENVADLNKIARDSLRDADRALGQTSALTKMASSLSQVMTKTAKVVYAEDYQTMADDSSDMSSEVGDMSHDMHDIIGQADDSDDEVQDLISMAMDLRRARREEILVQAAKKKAPAAKSAPAKPSKAKGKAEEEEEAPKSKKMKDEEPKKSEKASKKEEPKEEKSDDAKEKKTASLKEIVSEAFSTKKADQDREVYKLKLRRAFDVALEMQKKGLIGMSKTALDKQVDDIMDFDDRAFEAFKRSVANAKSISSVKIATDLGGVNVGVESSEQSPSKSSSDILKMLWE